MRGRSRWHRRACSSGSAWRGPHRQQLRMHLLKRLRRRPRGRLRPWRRSRRRCELRLHRPHRARWQTRARLQHGRRCQPQHTAAAQLDGPLRTDAASVNEDLAAGAERGSLRRLRRPNRPQVRAHLLDLLRRALTLQASAAPFPRSLRTHALAVHAHLVATATRRRLQAATACVDRSARTGAGCAGPHAPIAATRRAGAAIGVRLLAARAAEAARGHLAHKAAVSGRQRLVSRRARVADLLRRLGRLRPRQPRRALAVSGDLACEAALAVRQLDGARSAGCGIGRQRRCRQRQLERRHAFAVGRDRAAGRTALIDVPGDLSSRAKLLACAVSPDLLSGLTFLLLSIRPAGAVAPHAGTRLQRNQNL